MTDEIKMQALKSRLDALSETANPGPYGVISYGSGTTYLTLGTWVGHYASDTVPPIGGGRAEIVNSNVPSAWWEEDRKGSTAHFLAELANSYREGRIHVGAAPLVEDGVASIAAERRRQIEAEGWTPEHDDAHADGQMALAATEYVAHGGSSDDERAKFPAGAPSENWPWDRSWWKPKSRREDLVRAGALIAAEIDRLDRAAIKDQMK